MASQVVEMSLAEQLVAVADQDDFRCWEARLHVNPNDPASRSVATMLRAMTTKVGRAGHEALAMLFACLRIVVDPTDSKKLLSAELVVPCLNPDKLLLAKALLDPKRLAARDLNGDATAVKKESPLTPQRQATPQFLNSYRLVEVLPAEGELPVRLRFVIALAYKYVPNKGPRTGKTVWDISVIPANILQRLITTYLPAPLLQEIPRQVRDGLCQELAQALLSHLGLKEEGSQEEVGVASMAGSDPRVAKQEHIPFKRQPLRFVNSDDVVVCRRNWVECGREQSGFYVALPFGQHTRSERDWWWRRRLTEFTPLPLWPGQELKPRQKLLLLPLAVRSDHHFVVSLSDRQWQPCWSLVVPRGKEFFLQIITRRRVVPVSRPNVLGIHFAQMLVDGGHETRLYWSLYNLGQDRIVSHGYHVVDMLPDGRPWPNRANRKRLSYNAARWVVSLALAHNADLAVEEVSGIKKRGRDSEANALATRFNYSDLATRIGHKANDVERPVVVWSVHNWLLKDNKELPHPQQADLVAVAGLAIRSRKKK